MYKEYEGRYKHRGKLIGWFSIAANSPEQAIKLKTKSLNTAYSPKERKYLEVVIT